MFLYVKLVIESARARSDLGSILSDFVDLPDGLDQA